MTLLTIGSIIMLLSHYFIMAMLGIYGLHRLYLTWRQARSPAPQVSAARFAMLPSVTVQLPIFNERTVIKRLIDAAAALDYPADRLEIQILDDSTDETASIAAARVAHHRALGVNIEHVRRPDRSGFKAGALAYGLERAQGEFLLILDADFVPAPEFLRSLIDPLADPGVAMVQARWDYFNRGPSLLTRAQGVLLDAHFAIEHNQRAARDVFFNFNGTAGIWRKQAIRDAGGWRADTLTEDLDLSYRVQLAGWRFVYRGDVICRSELPADMNAFKTQQHRWTKGSIEVMLRIMPLILRAKLPIATKIEAFMHLTSNLSYLFVILECMVLFIPVILIRDMLALDYLFIVDMALLLLASFSHASFFFFGQRELHGRPTRRLPEVAVLVPLMIGLAFNNGRAALEALLGIRSGFVRTPKQGDDSSAGAAQRVAKYRAVRSRFGEWIEVAFGLVFIVCAFWMIDQQYWLSAPIALLFGLSFLAVGVGSMQARQLPTRRLAPA